MGRVSGLVDGGRGGWGGGVGSGRGVETHPTSSLPCSFLFL